LREEFKAIFECASFNEAKKYFEFWLTSVKAAAVKDILKVAETFK